MGSLEEGEGVDFVEERRVVRVVCMCRWKREESQLADRCKSQTTRQAFWACFGLQVTRHTSDTAVEGGH